MFLLDISNLVPMMASAQGPTQLLAAADWPLHKALLGLVKEAEEACLGEHFADLSFRPDPDCGWRAAGVDEAIWSLRSSLVLIPTGSGMDAGWVVDRDKLWEARRLFLTLRPELAVLIYRAGISWASLASTALKNWATPRSSSGDIVTSPTTERQMAIVGRL